MKVQKISHSTSQSRKFINKSMQTKAQILLDKIASETKLLKDKFPEKHFRTELDIPNMGKIIDENHIIETFEPSHLEMRIGDNTLYINNGTREIESYNKPSFFSSWKSILKKAEEMLNIAAEHYNDAGAVKKNVNEVKALDCRG